MTARAFKSERHHALDAQFPREPQPRSYVQAYRPAPARRATWWRRALRAVLRSLTW